MSYPQRATNTLIAKERANDDTCISWILHLIKRKITTTLHGCLCVLLLNVSIKLRLLTKYNLPSYSYALLF